MSGPTAPIESILLSTVRIGTFDLQRPLTTASGFFFERADGALFLVTNRHVVLDEGTNHRPNRIEIELHTEAENMAQSTTFSIPLYPDGISAWREGTDGGGSVDIAVLELDRAALPAGMIYRAFTAAHLASAADRVGVGTPLLIVGFPLGFHDLLHHLPVARHAVIASSFGMRFQGQGVFLTDARTHRGTSGAPVVMRSEANQDSRGGLPWVLLGVHSSRWDVGTRDAAQDEALGLNSAWYADMLLTLTQPRDAAAGPPPDGK